MRKFLRFVFPFLFVRNWYDGNWEFSRARLYIFGTLALLVLLALFLMYMMQAPVIYTSTSDI